MKFLKLLLLLAVKGLIAVTHGAVIDPFLQKPSTKELERPHQKPQSTGGNLLIAPSRAHSSKSKDAQREEKIHNVRKKGKGLKRDPCLRKYKDFCFHGTCRFLKVTKDPYCVCQAGYHGERCHALTLPLGNPPSTYDHTTVLAVVAVVLSSFCLIVISSLLILRYHRTGAYHVDNEKKIKFASPT
ncbi:proheparin-binding EGF-like growth factor isoform X2 [Bufo bufo]|uniref:proheparin-binding EGF-like growth factor isoform X2 n=1 Tax=Bufo bufo TaxID=8384 RepID=UPI001ABDB7D7|nr:proheparin-binding EGF-like growth factor isoform X2 [Bufo bufo]